MCLSCNTCPEPAITSAKYRRESENDRAANNLRNKVITEQSGSLFTAITVVYYFSPAFVVTPIDDM